MSKKKQKSGATASYARGVLTIDLPDARDPMLWRQEIKDVTRISFALQHLPGGDRALVLRADGGSEQIIATFDHSEAADEALAAVREILLRPQGTIPGWLRGLLRIAKWIAIVFIVIWLVGFGIRFYLNFMAVSAMQEMQQKSENEPKKEIPEGVPLIADDYLEAPE